MEVKIVEDKKTRLVFDIDGESNTITGALRTEMWNDSHVKAVGYNHDHPLIETARFVVETDTSEEPRKAFSGAIKRLQKEIEKLKEGAKSLK